MAETINPKPALWDVLSVLLPTAEQTLFLQACLQSGEMAQQAWDRWQAQTGGLHRYLERDGSVGKRLLPLLYHSLRRNRVVTHPDVAPLLKNAYVREQSRYKDYRRILLDVLSVLTDGQVSTVVLKGAALAETVYPEPALRHSHDIDLLVEPRDLSTAVSLLVSSGFRPLPLGERAMPYTLLCHSSGLAIGVYTDLFALPYYTRGEGALVQEIASYAQEHNFGGAESHIFSPAVNLLQVLGHASYAANRRSLVWVCDAWFLTGDKAGQDWDLFSDLAVRRGLALPLSIMLSFLARSLNAPIPMPVLERLQAAAARTESLGYEVALGGARNTANGRIKNLLGKSRGLAERKLLLKWILFPSPRYLELQHKVRYPRLLPLYYVLRPVRYVARRYLPNKMPPLKPREVRVAPSNHPKVS